MSLNKTKGLRLVLGAAVLGAGAIAAVTLFRGETTQQVVDQPAVAEKVLRIGNAGEVRSLDPHLTSGTWEDRVNTAMFEGITTKAPDGKVIAGLAESWDVSADGKTYTFKLRDAKWSDGTPITSADVVYSFQRLMDPATGAEYASLHFGIVNAEDVNGGKKPVSELGVKAVDDKTFSVSLNNPVPYFLELLTHHTAFPIPKHVVEKHGSDWTKVENVVGSGPYNLTTWVPNDRLEVVKNPNYYDVANVKIDKITFDPTEDRNTMLKKFRAGELDILHDFPKDQIAELKKERGNELDIVPYLGTYYYPINVTVEPFNDVRVRQALAMVIDREAIVNEITRTGEIAAYAFVPPGMGGKPKSAEVSWKPLSMDERIAKAKELLAEAGFGADNPLKFTLSYNTSENHKKMAIAIQSMWKQHLGAEVDLFNQDAGVHYDGLRQRNYQVGRAGWIADYDDAQNFLFLAETKSGPQNYSGWSNAEFDRLMDESAKAQDPEKRAELMYQAEVVLMEEMPYIPIHYYVTSNIVGKHVSGFISNAGDRHPVRWMDITK